MVEDTSTPYIVIKGDGILEHEVGSEFSDPGAKVLRLVMYSSRT